ncbi:MAG TPA: tRNA (adenosine(37)-N6)-threonylcarbamoyltransferase complex dimerization subunit type 1 TsaB, partial [Propionibacterium sp.]|nr:tRNA (adenosine(37)-N6)-threonylcarbamoyltransferase complex dimerization subunit type 1 TsaB [Propionibacterium sp.]
MSTTLAVDTSTVVAAAIAVDGRIAASATVDDTRAHAEALMPLVQRVAAAAGIALADVDRIVAGVGPGPFTGLRVGVVTATTLAEVLGVPVAGACSLDAVAAQWAASGAPAEFLVVSDARRNEVYWARYDATGRRVAGPEVSAPDALPDLPLAGPGAPLVG